MDEEKLGTEKLGKLIFTMTISTIAAQIVNLMYSVVDRMYIGHIENVGGEMLTGIGVVTPVIMIISAFSSFVGGGGAPLASIAAGKGDHRLADRILGNGFSLLLILSVVVPSLFLIVKRPFLYFIGASDATYGYANEYITAYLVGTVMVMITVGLTPFIIAQGNSRTAMLSVIIGAVANIALDPLFIFVFNMGVRGAAVATVISQTLSAVWVLYYLVSDKAQMRIRKEFMIPDIKIILKIASLGVSTFVMSITESLISIVMNNGLKRYGGDVYVGCLTVMQSVMQFVSVPLTGYTQGVTPVISYNYGAGERGRVKGAFYISLAVLFIYTFSLALLSILFPGMFARMFTSSADIIALTERSLPIFMAGMLVFGIQRACQTTFVALGQAKISLFIALLRKVILLVPLALIFPIFWGADGIFYAEPVSDTIAALTCGMIFLFTFNKILSRSGPAKASDTNAGEINDEK